MTQGVNASRRLEVDDLLVQESVRSSSSGVAEMRDSISSAASADTKSSQSSQGIFGCLKNTVGRVFEAIKSFFNSFLSFFGVGNVEKSPISSIEKASNELYAVMEELFILSKMPASPEQKIAEEKNSKQLANIVLEFMIVQNSNNYALVAELRQAVSAINSDREVRKSEEVEQLFCSALEELKEKIKSKVLQNLEKAKQDVEKAEFILEELYK